MYIGEHKMAILNDIKGGADLTHPHASVSWGLGAVAAVVFLFIVVGIASWMYTKGKNAVTGAASKTGITGNLESISGTMTGWY